MTSPPTPSTARRRWPRVRAALLEGLVLLAIFLVVRAWTHRNLPQGQAPPLSGPYLDSNLEPRALHPSDYLGRPLVVHFWATWCPVCRQQESTLNALVGTVPLLTVATSSGDSGAVRLYLQKHGLQLPVLVDNSGEMGRQWGVSALPTTFFLNADGTIQFVETGYTSGPGIRIRHMLLKPTPPSVGPVTLFFPPEDPRSERWGRWSRHSTE